MAAVRTGLGTFAGILAIGLLLPCFAGASGHPPFLLQIPEDSAQPGAGAADLDNPAGIVADATSGAVYVSEFNNARVSAYTAWGAFIRAWGWGVETGAAELQTCGPVEPDPKPDPAVCRGGIVGAGRGQLSSPSGIAMDSEGHLYVHEFDNRRVQKFTSTGAFVVMFGGDVNKTKVDEGAPSGERNRCPVSPGDICQAGVAGASPGHFGGAFQDVIGYSATNNAIVLGDKDRIQVFDVDGTFREEIPFEGPLAAFDGKTVTGLDVDADGNIYFVVGGAEDVYKLGPSGEPVAPGKPGESLFKVANPSIVAIGAEGEVHVVDDPPGIALGLETRIVEFDAEGNVLMPTPEEEKAGLFFPFISSSGPQVWSLATNLCPGSELPGNLYLGLFRFGEVAKVDFYGSPPIGCEPPPERPPEVTAQFATFVGTDAATVKALINPRFWADTAYFVEYGTGKCSEGGCDRQRPVPPGLDLTDDVVNTTLATAGLQLTGLSPDTVYHYRFVAQSGGGGPVYGLDPDGDGPQEPGPADGLEATLTTFRSAGPTEPCPNDALRLGAAARLPDCRAYELVSPLHKGNADIGLLREERFIELNQAALSGDGFTFSSITSFGDSQGAPYVSQYLARRDPAQGWRSENISAPHTTTPLDANSGLNNEFKAFSADLCTAWLRHNSYSRLTSEAVLGYPNLYKRDNCGGSPAYEAVTTVKPPKRPAEKYWELSLKGFSDDGTHTVYAADDKLHAHAPTLQERELSLYEHVGGETRFVCYLPNGKPISQACSAGTLGPTGVDLSSLHNAVSADGSHIFWSAYVGATESKQVHPGQLYVRIDGKETVAISGAVSASAAYFWTAADDGSKAIFEIVEGPLKGNLYEFDVASKTATLIAKGVDGPMGASEDASRIYFASVADLDATGPATAGKHNLYLYEVVEGGAGTFSFITALAPADIGSLSGASVFSSLKPIERAPAVRAAAVSADGRQVTFMSSASPTGYDNRDAVTGELDAEVYRYDAETEELLCISCNPTGARPSGVKVDGSWVAARIQAWELHHHAPHALSFDGLRIFFESHDALVPRDTNGRWDVYQWEKPGKGTCSEDDATFHEANGGCVELISSGESAADSLFLDADPSGDNVFVGTQSSLIGTDYGLNDVYVARVGGGFPEPTAPVECEGESCPTPRPAPPEATPPSATVKPPNPATRHPCPKGKRKVKRKGKIRCVKRKKAARHRRGNRKRGGRR